MTATRWSLLGVAVVAALVWWLVHTRGDDEVTRPAATAPAPAASVRPPRAPALPARERTAALPRIPEEVSHHLADPCRSVGEPTIPSGMEELTQDGITIAWPPGGLDDQGPSEIPLRPITLAHVVRGLLAEAAELTGTSPRSTLTVVLYATADELRARTKAPAWAEALYDGAAVRVPLVTRRDLGVSLETLRHEVMHAQLHATVGCMPAWLNEGLAMYFAEVAPISEWIALLRQPVPLEVKTLGAPTIDEARAEIAARLYAQSLAMVVFLAERGGDKGLRSALEATRDDAADLWPRIGAGGDDAVLDAIARRVFGVPRGPELESVLGGPICCHGLRSLGALGCRGVAARQSGEPIWIDRSTSPRSTCRARW